MELQNLTTIELLRHVDRSNEEVKELAEKLETLYEERIQMMRQIKHVAGDLSYSIASHNQSCNRLNLALKNIKAIDS